MFTSKALKVFVRSLPAPTPVKVVSEAIQTDQESAHVESSIYNCQCVPTGESLNLGKLLKNKVFLSQGVAHELEYIFGAARPLYIQTA